MAKKVTILLNCTYNDGKKTYAPGETLSLDVKEAEALEKICLVSYPTTKPVEERAKKDKSQQTDADAKNGADAESNADAKNGSDAENNADAENNSEQNNTQEGVMSEGAGEDAQKLDPDALDALEGD